MSVQKLLTRIVRPSDLLSETGKQAKTASELHDHTFGITSDPLCQFAVVLSALIHDAGHPGVSNAVLVNEEDPMATKYNNQSVAEQNSGKRSVHVLKFTFVMSSVGSPFGLSPWQWTWLLVCLTRLNLRT